MSLHEQTLTSSAPRPTRAMERWLWPTELERRLEAHLLIARRIGARVDTAGTGRATRR
ncbi:MAG TPA: hypothetical protein VFR07_00040 [Mycobacteriales bacterium]|nr:hypothetical protein [Mycobacteriales bacterium]